MLQNEKNFVVRGCVLNKGVSGTLAGVRAGGARGASCEFIENGHFWSLLNQTWLPIHEMSFVQGHRDFHLFFSCWPRAYVLIGTIGAPIHRRATWIVLHRPLVLGLALRRLSASLPEGVLSRERCVLRHS